MSCLRIATLFSFLVLAGTSVAADAPNASAPETAADKALGRKVPAFTADLIDVSSDPPKVEKFDSSKVKKPTAYIFVGTTCPATNAYAERLHEIAAAYRAKGVDFIYLYPNRDDTREAKIEFQKSKQLGPHLIDDQGAALARQFGAQRTSEIFLADKSGTVLFHGQVDDNRDAAAVKQRYFAPALDEMLAGKTISVPYSQVFA